MLDLMWGVFLVLAGVIKCDFCLSSLANGTVHSSGRDEVRDFLVQSFDSNAVRN